ncbi:MAG: cell division protein ZipA C-terminal FtsZ-binding domain-containing protein [Rhodocyclaceae bacterium]
MAGNELQYGLIGAGVVLVLALIIYNVWQEHRARKHAEQVFRSTHRDVLLDEAREPVIPPAPGGRFEPGLPADDEMDVRVEPRIDTPAAPPVQSMRAQEPALPWEQQAIDCVINIEAPAGVSAAALYTAQQGMLAGLQRNLMWYGWDEVEHRWLELDARSPGSVTRVAVALQLVDRRGRIGENELERFYDLVQGLCDQFLAVPRLPARADVLARAHDLDAFASEVDIQIAVNVVANKAAFAGTKLRGLAEAAGMRLLGDGAYHFEDEAERTLFTVANQESAAFSPEQLRYLHTHAVTLMIDVPRVVNPLQAFDKMIACAAHLAESLDGTIVDDNRMPLSERSVGLIRNQIGQFAQRMDEQAVAAGGELACRLFA